MVTILIALSGSRPVVADQLLIPMNLDQTDHLKAYGVAYWALQKSIDVEWLLNFRGGSFLMDYTESVAGESRLRDVSFARISDAQAARIYAQMEEGKGELGSGVCDMLLCSIKYLSSRKSGLMHVFK